MAKAREWTPLAVSELAYEMGNVLSIIETLGSQLLEEIAPSGDGVHIVDDLIHTAERARRLSLRLTQLAYETASAEPADLAAVVSRLATTLRRVTPQKIEVVIDAGPRPIWTSLSALDLEQIVFNLVHNAFDAMPDGGVLAIQLTASAGESTLTVRDTGVGMDENTLQRRLPPMFTRIGLHAVRDTVEDAGGRVIVASAHGAGTMISVYLPTLDAPS